MIVYFDTSALVKLYLDEPGSVVASQLWDQDALPCASVLLVPEILATFARKRREGDLPEDEATLIQEFERDWLSILPFAIDDAVFKLCMPLLQRHALRSADAVHLATAMLVRSMSSDPMQFACADLALIAAARSEGLEVAVTL